MRQFARWFGEALKAKVPEPNAMTLATVGDDGRPGARIVLLKGFDAEGFVFYTNYTSRKGQDLTRNAAVALLLYWIDIARQVRIEGRATQVGAAESDAYHASRPRASQLAAWASPQSEVIADRAALETRYAATVQRYGTAERVVPRPPFWGGYRVCPDRIEFWQGRGSRLHDRLLYRRATPCAAWAIERLAP